MAGDLNDVPGSAALRVLGSDGDGALFDCASGVAPAARFSIFHAGRPMQLDHVLATANLFGRLSSARFFNEALRDHGPFVAGADEPPTVDSDHAPLVVRFS